MKIAQLDQLLHLEHLDDWRRALFALGWAYGFDKVLFRLTGPRHARREFTLVESNYPDGWREHYDAERYVYVDPVVSHCLAGSLPLVWDAQVFAAAAHQALYRDACSYGIRAGVSFPMHGPNGESGLLCFAADMAPDAAFLRDVEAMLPDLALVRDYAFASGVRFCPTTPAEAAPKLTPRELEVLGWVMAGKSSWEISKITGCAETTVKFHMGNIRQKFNVNTRQQAVVKAISLGLITPEDHRR